MALLATLHDCVERWDSLLHWERPGVTGAWAITGALLLLYWPAEYFAALPLLPLLAWLLAGLKWRLTGNFVVERVLLDTGAGLGGGGGGSGGEGVRSGGARDGSGAEAGDGGVRGGGTNGGAASGVKAASSATATSSSGGGGGSSSSSGGGGGGGDSRGGVAMRLNATQAVGRRRGVATLRVALQRAWLKHGVRRTNGALAGRLWWAWASTSV